MTQTPQTNVGELRRRGFIKLKAEDMYSIWVKTASCTLSSEQLRKLADITDKYARSYLLFTVRQNAVIPYVNSRDVDEVKEELSQVYLDLDRCGPIIRNINVCYEAKICPYAVTNSISLAEKLDNFFYDYTHLRHKTKLGVAGCKQDCITSRVLTDVGFVSDQRDGKTGYDAYVGGQLGSNPFVGIKMAELLSEEECVKFAQNYFELLENEGKEKERAANVIKRLGTERVKQELNKNLQERVTLKPISRTTSLTKNATDKLTLRLRATCGEVTSKQLRKIADIAERYGHGFVYFAVRCSPEIPGIDSQHLESIRNELQEADLQIMDKGIDNFVTCCFGADCTENIVEPRPLIRKIEKMTEELGLNNLDIKISAAGCPNACAIPHLSDIGLWGIVEPEVDVANCTGCELCVPVCRMKAIVMEDGIAVIDQEKCNYCNQCIVICPFDAIAEKRKGYTLIIGGREGGDIRLGEVIAEFLSEKEVLQFTEKCLRIMKDKKANVDTIINQVGIEKFKEMLAPGTK